MFWNKEIKKEPKPITLENRLIDLIELNDTEVEIGYDRYYPSISPKESSFQEAFTIIIKTKWTKYCIWYMESYIWKTRLVLFEDDNENNGVELDINMAIPIKESVEEKIKTDFMKKLFPVDPEISKMMSNVEQIQDYKEQIDFITKEIHKIKWNPTN